MADASNAPTFLPADMETVATFAVVNLSRSGIENLLHRFLDRARPKRLTISDRSGKKVRPREWSCVLPEHVSEAAWLIREGTLHLHRYDPSVQKLGKKDASNPRSSPISVRFKPAFIAQSTASCALVGGARFSLWRSSVVVHHLSQGGYSKGERLAAKPADRGRQSCRHDLHPRPSSLAAGHGRPLDRQNIMAGADCTICPRPFRPRTKRPAAGRHRACWAPQPLRQGGAGETGKTNGARRMVSRLPAADRTSADCGREAASGGSGGSWETRLDPGRKPRAKPVRADTHGKSAEIVFHLAREKRHRCATGCDRGPSVARLPSPS